MVLKVKNVEVSVSDVVIVFTTRLHSSRMRTARLLPVSRGVHCTGGVVFALGGVCSHGGSAQWGASQHALRQAPL